MATSLVLLLQIHVFSPTTLEASGHQPNPQQVKQSHGVKQVIPQQIAILKGLQVSNTSDQIRKHLEYM